MALNHKEYVFRGNAYRSTEEMTEWAALRAEEPLEPELPIIDPHHHLWDDERGRYLLDEFLVDLNAGHNIVSTVYVDAAAMFRKDGPVEEQPIGEVEFVNGVAAMGASGRYGGTRVCAAIVGLADLRLGDRVEAVLEKLAAAGNGRFRGIRHGVIWDAGNAARFQPAWRQAPKGLMADDDYRRGLARLHAMGFSYDAWQYHTQLPELAGMLRAVQSEGKVIINHVGCPLGVPPYNGRREEIFATWSKDIRALAQFPNVAVKVGGLGMLYCGWDFHLRNVPPTSLELGDAWRPYIETCIEAFGVDRCMMESNFPVDKQSSSYSALWNALKRVTESYSPDEKRALYHDTAARAYGLAITPDTPDKARSHT